MAAVIPPSGCGETPGAVCRTLPILGRLDGDLPEVGAIDLVLESRTESGWGVLEVKGEVDLYTSPQLRDNVTEMIEQGQGRIIIDLTDVGFMDSSGLGVLVTALKRVRERDGSLALVCPEGSVHKVLTITGLDRVFPISGSVAEATAS
jgi:anti-sigma B factor antagonist